MNIIYPIVVQAAEVAARVESARYGKTVTSSDVLNCLLDQYLDDVELLIAVPDSEKAELLQDVQIAREALTEDEAVDDREYIKFAYRNPIFMEDVPECPDAKSIDAPNHRENA